MKRTTRNRIGAATCAVAALSFLFTGSACGEDVYAKALWWARGMAVDANSDGGFQQGELVDSLGVLGTITGTAGYGETQIAYTNVNAWLPYRGVKRIVGGLYFPQETVVTNSESNSGLLYPNNIWLPKTLTNKLSDQDGFTIAFRFRPDEVQPHPNMTVLMNMGHASGSGFLIGFGTPKWLTGTYSSTEYRVKVAPIWLSLGNNSWTPDSKTALVSLGQWNDLIVSFDGHTVKVFVSRDGHVYSDSSSSVGNSALGQWQTGLYSCEYPAAFTQAAKANAQCGIGTGNPWGTGSIAWKENDVSMGNAQRAFRGIIQSVAVWTNALSEVEMRQAAGWPRPDLWRVGVENDGTSEFKAPGSPAVVDVDADAWYMPASIPAGGSVTFRFPLAVGGEADMPQILRVKAATSSAGGAMSVSANGRVLSPVSVVPGKTAMVFVPESALTAGTNTLTLTRTDMGSSGLVIDSVVFGGSCQCGIANDTQVDFGTKGAGGLLKENDFWMYGGNWYEISRALYGMNYAYSSVSNLVLHVPMADNIWRVCDYRLKWKTKRTGHTMEVRVNDRSFGMFPSGDEEELAMPEYLIRQDNTIEFVSVETSLNWEYIAPDYIRLYAAKYRTGTYIIMR